MRLSAIGGGWLPLLCLYFSHTYTLSPLSALWLSTYLVKQVSTRTRVLVLVDVLKTRVFGRDTSLF